MLKNKKYALLCSISALCGAISIGSAHAAPGVQQVTASVQSDYAKTKYPILFTHGMFGFSRLGVAAFGLDYWYQILPDLARNGSTVFAAQISPLESTEVRGEQLLTQVEEVMALTGKGKVNLIGHSHGGPTIRYIEVVKPQYVASLTGVGATFRGSKVADDLLANRGGSQFLSIATDYIVGPVIAFSQGNSGLKSNLNASLKSISEQGSSAFNQRYPTPALASSCSQNGAASRNGVYYYSWTGTSQVTNILDVVDSAISVLGPISYGSLDNDGLVPRCNARFGKVIRDNYGWNHLDEVNQVLGIRGLFSTDPVSVYRQHANRLKLQGL
ncbi:MAG: triacylglycerol lipase [Acinetobacter sp.]